MEEVCHCFGGGGEDVYVEVTTPVWVSRVREEEEDSKSEVSQSSVIQREEGNVWSGPLNNDA